MDLLLIAEAVWLCTQACKPCMMRAAAARRANRLSTDSIGWLAHYYPAYVCSCSTHCRQDIQQVVMQPSLTD